MNRWRGPNPEAIRERIMLSELAREVTILKKASRGELVGLCPFHTEKTGSFYVNDRKGLFKCYGCGAGGDVFSFVKRINSTDFKGAREYLLLRLKWAPGGDPPPLKRKAAPARGDSYRRAQAISWAKNLWSECTLADNTEAERYLIGRGINTAYLAGMPSSLRYHRALRHAESNQKLGAMVASIQGPDGRLMGVHRTYLQDVPAGEEPEVAARLIRAGFSPKYGVTIKARVNPAKKMGGVCKGGAVRLANAGPTLIIAEGIETTLSAMQALEKPGWAALSLSNLAEILIPDQVHEIMLCADGDNKDKDAAEKQLQAAVTAYRDQGLRVRVLRPPDGMDFNDVLIKGCFNAIST